MPLRSRFNDGTLEIAIDGRFDFSVHRQFREAHASAPSATSYVVDLAAAEYIDSSALGMLLLLHEWAGKRNAPVVLRNCQDAVRKIIDIVHFEKLFRIE